MHNFLQLLFLAVVRWDANSDASALRKAFHLKNTTQILFNMNCPMGFSVSLEKK